MRPLRPFAVLPRLHGARASSCLTIPAQRSRPHVRGENRPLPGHYRRLLTPLESLLQAALRASRASAQSPFRTAYPFAPAQLEFVYGDRPFVCASGLQTESPHDAGGFSISWLRKIPISHDGSGKFTLNVRG